MTNLSMIESVNALLQSNITTITISKETGISKGHINNLRNGTKEIVKSSFDTVDKLYQYYLEKKDYLEASKNLDKAILDTKLPKDIQLFITSLNDTINSINEPSGSIKIEKLNIKRVFEMSNEKKSDKAFSYIYVDQLIPFQLKNEVISYELNFTSSIDKNKRFAEKINDFKINFAQSEFELMLKQLIYKGAKVKLIKSNFGHNNYSTGVYVNTHQDEIFKYENSFLSLTINDEIKEEES